MYFIISKIHCKIFYKYLSKLKINNFKIKLKIKNSFNSKVRSIKNNITTYIKDSLKIKLHIL